MRAKHNKKRNTAFLYEVLTRELTKSLIRNDNQRSLYVKNIIKEFFNDNKPLGRELACYTPLTQKVDTTQFVAEKIILECKKRHNQINQSEIFTEQSRLIKRINVDLGKEVFNTFVPNYRSYATVAQIFNTKTSVAQQVLLEEKIAKELISEENTETQPLEATDSLVVKSFVSRFNSEYGTLLPEQKELLKKYITSFGDSTADFQLYVGNQLNTIRKHISESLHLEEVKSDDEMKNNTNQVIEKLNKLNVSEIGTTELLTIMRLQSLVNEYKEDAAQD